MSPADQIKVFALIDALFANKKFCQLFHAADMTFTSLYQVANIVSESHAAIASVYKDYNENDVNGVTLVGLKSTFENMIESFVFDVKELYLLE